MAFCTWKGVDAGVWAPREKTLNNPSGSHRLFRTLIKLIIVIQGVIKKRIQQPLIFL
jgi:hypothetical protein